MSTPTTASSPKNLRRTRRSRRLFFAFCLSLLSLYPIYKNFYNGRAITTYDRHQALIAGRSEFYNPWQYRMLCPILIEGMVWVYDHTVDKVYPIEQKIHFHFDETSEPTPETKEFIQLMQTPGAIKYMIVFLFFRFVLNFLVFVLAWRLWRYFVDNDWLILFGLIFVSLAMGNGVIASDLTFNTYVDNVFYLLAACLIVYKKNPLWLLPLMALAAFNRETSMMIPFLFFISQMDFSRFTLRPPDLRAIRWPAPRVWALVAGCYALFFAIFIGVRLHYGYRPPQVWKVPPGPGMLKLNLASSVGVKSYFEMLGLFSVIPFIILYTFRRYPLLLRVWFLGIVPAWFAVHLYTVVTYQTRLFLVPTILVMVPMLLWLIENGAVSGARPAEPVPARR
ncbi:MAG: hypothetical protein Q8932_16135 [Bacteroidota bacterium]|nr:hypothetical protein [Bacteroidota bacterium]MDP4247369.1 hypothetical protein [Bacteroidota bacterium]MDP4254339.1 hypothetical protein [Bacteroidota bacterium]MDP4260386.1 hypothetical protein [Bacteroidota bacterium]